MAGTVWNMFRARSTWFHGTSLIPRCDKRAIDRDRVMRTATLMQENFREQGMASVREYILQCGCYISTDDPDRANKI